MPLHAPPHGMHTKQVLAGWWHCICIVRSRHCLLLHPYLCMNAIFANKPFITASGSQSPQHPAHDKHACPLAHTCTQALRRIASPSPLRSQAGQTWPKKVSKKSSGLLTPTSEITTVPLIPGVKRLARTSLAALAALSAPGRGDAAPAAARGPSSPLEASSPPGEGGPGQGQLLLGALSGLGCRHS